MNVPRLPRSARTWAALLAVVVALAVAGVVGYVHFDDGATGPMDRVPQRADAVAHVDVDGMTASERRRTLTERAFAVQDDHPFYRGPRTADRIRALRASPHVDLEAARSLTFFVALDANATRQDDYEAVIVRAPWAEDALVRTVEDEANVTLRRSGGDGRPLYEPTGAAGPTVAVLGEDTYAVGDRAAVADARAVAAGDRAPVEGQLRERFRAARDGYVTVAYPFPHDVVPELPSVVGRGFAHTQLVTGVYYANETANGTRLGARFGLHTNDSDAARNLQATVGLGLQLYAANTDDPVLREAAHGVLMRRDGASVLLVYEAAPERVRQVLERLDR